MVKCMVCQGEEFYMHDIYKVDNSMLIYELPVNKAARRIVCIACSQPHEINEIGRLKMVPR